MWQKLYIFFIIKLNNCVAVSYLIGAKYRKLTKTQLEKLSNSFIKKRKYARIVKFAVERYLDLSIYLKASVLKELSATWSNAVQKNKLFLFPQSVHYLAMKC